MLIKAEKRELTGKKVRQLRKDKKLPAVIYGPSRESTNISVDPFEFRRLFKDVGYSKLFDMELDGKNVKVLVKDLQNNVLTDEIVHVDFYQVDMKKPISAEVPIEFVGESYAAKNNIGLLVHSMTSVEVKCLPADLPAKLVVEVSDLREIGDSIAVEDLKLPEGVEFDADVAQDVPVVYIAAPQKTVEEEEAEAAEAEASEEAEEGEEGEGDEGTDEGTEESGEQTGDTQKESKEE